MVYSSLTGFCIRLNFFLVLLILTIGASSSLHAEDLKVETNQLAKMGKLIFTDKRFSASGKTSCSSCHQPEHAFSDSVPFSVKDDGQLTDISTPPLFNMKQKIGYFSREPVFRMEEAVERCMKENLGVSILEIYVTLKKDATLSRISTHIYGRASAGAVFSAIVAYLETLQTSKSRYDRYMEGELLALTTAEQAGLVLFEQKGCAHCHTGRGLGGMVYGENIDEDSTRRVQVPRLRNLSSSRPYFSDGSAETLEDAVRAMSKKYSAQLVDNDELEKIRIFLLSHESSINDLEGAVDYEYAR